MFNVLVADKHVKTINQTVQTSNNQKAIPQYPAMFNVFVRVYSTLLRAIFNVFVRYSTLLRAMFNVLINVFYSCVLYSETSDTWVLFFCCSDLGLSFNLKVILYVYWCLSEYS